MTDTVRDARPILVTGSSGFIGGYLAARLAQDGVTVDAVDSRPPRTHAPSGCTPRALDCHDADLLRQVGEAHYQAVIHMAGVSDTLCQDTRLLERENVEAPLALAAAADQSSTPMVYASSFSVYGRTFGGATRESDLFGPQCSGPLNHYASSKLALDRLVVERHEGAALMGLRFTNVFSPDEPLDNRSASIVSRIVARAAAGATIDLFADTLTASRDYVPAEKIYSVVRAFLKTPTFGIFNLGSGVDVTFANLLSHLSVLSTAPIEVRLVRNPIAAQYQYKTLADNSGLTNLYDEAAPLTSTEVLEEIGRCYRARSTSGTEGGPR